MEAKTGAWLSTNHVALKAIRELNGLTRDELAKRVGVSRITIYYLETGKRNPTTELGKKISKALNVPLRAIFIVHD